MFRRVPRREVGAELSLLGGSGGFVSPERAARTLAYLATDPAVMTVAMVGRLLSYDEAAIRAETVRLWLSEPRDQDEDVLVRMFSDDHLD